MLLLMASLWSIRFLEGAANHSNGPIALAVAAIDCFASANYFPGRHYQCIWFGPLDFWRVLLMHSDGPIALADAAANAFRWADCISRCCCQWLCFGPLFFLEALLM